MRLGCVIGVLLVTGLAVAVHPAAAAEPPNPEEMIGQPAPGWKGVSDWVNLPAGKETLSPADFRGKVLVLVFCQKACRGSQQHMLPLAKQLADHCAKSSNKVAFVAIQTAFQKFDENTPAAVAEMAKTHNITFPFGHMGEEGKMPRILFRYKAKGTPWLIVIDSEGIIRASGYEFRGQDVVDHINALVGKATGEAPPAETPGEKPAKPAETPPEKPAKPQPPSPAAEKLKEQLDGVLSRFQTVATQEMEVRMRIMTAQQKAMQVVKDQDEAAKKLAKGQYTKELRAYEQMMVAIIRQLRGFDTKLASVHATLNRLRTNPAAAEIKTDFDRVAAMIEKRRVNLLDQIGDYCVKAGRLEEAVKIYDRLRSILPLDAKDMRRSYREKTASAYEKFEKWASAVNLYELVYKGLSPTEQKQELNLRLKLGNLYQHVGRKDKALEMYEGVKKDLPAGQKIDGLDAVIAQLKARA